MAIEQRTVSIQKTYKSEENGKVGKLNSTYLGFVKDNTDTLSMGRIKVWIPELSTDPQKGLFTVNYCSAFAGASGLGSVGSQSQSQSQTSYGMWTPPPDIDNEVVVLFINGDPNRGIYIGGLFQQYMNNMVPGIPKGDTTGSGGNQAPVQEYNKKDSSQAIKSNPQRPTYTKLSDALTNQGLDHDDVLGNSTSSARRESPSKVMGILSQGGSQIVVDDHPSNQFIRFRTATGVQVLLNDTIGNIYMITKNGNAWLELSDSGVNIYSANSISLRAQQDLNLHADGSLNLFSAKGVNIATSNTVGITGLKGINLKSNKDINQSAIGSISLVTNASANISAKTGINAFSRDKIALTANNDFGITTGTDFYVSSSKSYTNSKDGPVATGAADVQPASFGTMSDNALDKDHSSISTKTNTSTLPTHEPFSGHAGSSTPPAQQPVDLNNSTRSNTDVQPYSTPGSSSDIQQGQSSSAPTLPSQTGTDIPVPTGDNTGYFNPTTGKVTSVYGPRGGGFHPGVDIGGGNNGNSIVAVKSGTVVWAAMGTPGSGYNGYGNCVCIDHGGGFKSLYGHMSSLGTTRGASVTQGQVIGQVGSTGMSTGPHLHFEIRMNGSATDPKGIISALGNNGASISAGSSSTMVAAAKLPATTTNASAANVSTTQTGTANV